MSDLFSESTIPRNEELVDHKLDNKVGLLSELLHKDEQICNLKKEIDDLKRAKLIYKLSGDDGIEKYVDKLLADKMVNSAVIPDFIERKIYINVVTLILGVLKDTVNSSSIDLIGNKITLHMD